MCEITAATIVIQDQHLFANVTNASPNRHRKRQEEIKKLPELLHSDSLCNYSKL